jgi:anti-anti-sigma regulatory factor
VKKEKSPAMIMDFSGVPYTDWAGLGAVVGAFVSAYCDRRELAFSGSHDVRSVESVRL